jgi:hypothetical protein
MFFKVVCFILCVFFLMPHNVQGEGRRSIDFGRWSENDLEKIIVSARLNDKPGDQIVSISDYFVDTPYIENTLIGGPHTSEQLVLNLSGFDCFTFLDVVEAFRRAQNVDDLSKRLQEVRYRDAKISYWNRRHFFSDWVSNDSDAIVDVTTLVGQGRTQTVVKYLNLKNDGNNWLPEIPVVRREITYISTHMIDQTVLSALKSGDYVGIFSNQPGLDASHTGLVVKKNDHILLRHASSQNGLRRVVDVDLLTYLMGKPGLVVYRVK